MFIPKVTTVFGKDSLAALPSKKLNSWDLSTTFGIPKLNDNI
jgi:hypothetical protein